MADEPPYILDIGGLRDAQPEDEPPGSCGPRKWIGVQFECCGVYTRIYRNPAQTAYVGACPRCLRKVSVRVGPGGTNSRMFRAT